MERKGTWDRMHTHRSIGSARRLRAAVSLLLLGAGLAACTQTSDDAVATARDGRLMVAAVEAGSPLHPLEGREVSGIVRVVIVFEDTLQRVAFHLDDPTGAGDALWVSHGAPHEFVLDTATFEPGSHTLYAFGTALEAARPRLVGRASFAVATTLTDPGLPPVHPNPVYDHLEQIYVHPSGSDAATGDRSAPLRSVREAIQRAWADRVAGLGTRINVLPGVYREALIGSFGTDRGPPIVIEATVPGAAVVSGSDVWTDWDCSVAVCTHEWPFRWGVAPNPWPSIPVGELARRREMVVWNGMNLDQRATLGALSPGAFFVDEVNGRLYVHPPATGPVDGAIVEVAVRPTLLRLQGLSDLVIGGMAFTHAATEFRRAALEIVDQSDVAIDSSTIVWNGQGGISLKGRRFAIRNTTMNDNGSSGVSGFQVADVSIEDSETSFNNWRGIRDGYTDWEVGQKFMSVHRLVVRRHVSSHNATRGFWLDTDVEDVLIEDSRFCDNLTNGLFVEASQGPVEVRNTVFCGNVESGLLTSATHRLTLDGNLFDRNRRSQVHVSGDFGRSSIDWETGHSYLLNNADWAWHENVFVGSGEHLIIGTTHTRAQFDDLLRSSTFDRNTYVHDVDRSFGVPGGGRLDFVGWQADTGQDPSSSFSAAASLR